MGCHTWFGKRMNMTTEEAVNNFVTNHRKYIQELKDIRDGTHDDPEVRSLLSLTTVESVQFNIDVAERQLRMVEKGLCRKAVMNQQPGHKDYIDGNFYDFDDDSLPHDLFRIGGYPDNNLFSYEETLDFLEYKGPEIYGYSDDLKQQLKDFWEKFPDGIIRFG